MRSSPPPWQAHNSANYDATMTGRCSALLAKIVADPASRQAILSDPRILHRELFAPFAPPKHGKYAGSYRGTPGTSLADRRVSAASLIEAGGEYEFCQPIEVPGRMDRLLQQTQDLLGDARADDFGKLIALAYTFCWFGKVQMLSHRVV